MKLRYLLSTLLVFALLLTACGADTGDQDGNFNDNGNGAGESGLSSVTEMPLPGTGASSTQGVLATQGVMATQIPAGAEGVLSTQGAATAQSGVPTLSSLPTQAVVGQSAATQAAQSTPGAAAAPGGSYGSTPQATQSGGAALPGTGKPAQSERAEVRGPRDQIARLSSWLGFQLLGQDGRALGSVSDYVINTCETYIVYMVVTPANGGERILVPYELATINSGAVDAQSKAIIVNATPELLAQAPTFPQSASLTSGDWEGALRAYWQQSFRVSSLSTTCNAPGGPVQKVAFASQLLNAQLKDGNQQLLGAVKEAIIEPESGSIDFFVVQTPDQQGYVLIPLGAVNIPEEALAQGQAPWLVLLTDTAMLQSAPRINDLSAGFNLDLQNAARGYWNQQTGGTPAAPQTVPMVP